MVNDDDAVEWWKPRGDGSQDVYRKNAEGVWEFAHILGTDGEEYVDLDRQEILDPEGRRITNEYVDELLADIVDDEEER